MQSKRGLKDIVDHVRLLLLILLVRLLDDGPVPAAAAGDHQIPEFLASKQTRPSLGFLVSRNARNVLGQQGDIIISILVLLGRYHGADGVRS